METIHYMQSLGMLSAAASCSSMAGWWRSGDHKYDYHEEGLDIYGGICDIGIDMIGDYQTFMTPNRGDSPSLVMSRRGRGSVFWITKWLEDA